MIKRKIYIAVLLVSSVFSINAARLDDAKELYLKNDYTQALPLLMEEYNKTPKNASLNHWIGVCLINTGRANESKSYLEFAQSKGILESPLYLAEIFYKEYNFEKAELYVNKYNAALKKAKKKATTDGVSFVEKFKKAQTMLDHVEKIQIIDSIIVDKNNFFKAYKISPEVGSLNDSSVLPYGKVKGGVVFMPESKARMMWSEPDSVGVRIMETVKLFDGKWDKAQPIDDRLKDGGSANYPFMMPDGSTLYYASDGASSIGGYDIFLTRKDSETGKYLQPQNVGMPFNSPFDDYMLVLDEYTGVGTWASDRNQIPGKLTLYIYILNDVRENYKDDVLNIASLAAIKSIKDSWTEGADYSEILQTVRNINPNKIVKKREFTFSIANSIIYTAYEDFKSSEAKNLMQKYETAKKTFEKNITKMKELRQRYSTIKSSLKESLQNEIIQLEQKIERDREELDITENSIRRAEQSKLNL